MRTRAAATKPVWAFLSSLTEMIWGEPEWRRHLWKRRWNRGFSATRQMTSSESRRSVRRAGDREASQTLQSQSCKSETGVCCNDSAPKQILTATFRCLAARLFFLKESQTACEQLTSTAAQSEDTSTRSSLLQAPLQGQNIRKLTLGFPSSFAQISGWGVRSWKDWVEIM